MAQQQNHIDTLEELEHRALDGDKDARLALGHEKVRLGLVEGGLRDLLQAFDQIRDSQTVEDALGTLLGVPALTFTKSLESKSALIQIQDPSRLSDDVRELARLGEGLRVYARDVQLSRPIDDQLEATVLGSIACFDKALQIAEREKGAPGERAWLYAHRGAAKMMVYWLLLTSSHDEPGNDALFDQCASDFEVARELMKPEPYPWSLQFSAFLYALRGAEAPRVKGQPVAVDDFDRAIEFLEEVPKGARPSSFQRSLAMLASYNAVGTSRKKKDPDARHQAARMSIQQGLAAVEKDQDESLAAYSAAVSYWALYEMSKSANNPPETERLRRNTDAAVDAARIRARNTISQALAAIVGLSFVRARLAWDDDQRDGTGNAKLSEVARESADLQSLFDRVRPDMETRAMFIRDPAWQAILDSDECRKVFANAGYDILRTLDYWRRQALVNPTTAAI
jgi:hypothetical protein